jgi:Transcription termination factor nusG
MANERWYVLRVRSGFAPVVAEKLRRLNLVAIFAYRRSTTHRKTVLRKPISGDYVYCRFATKKRRDIRWIPGVLDILDAPSSIAVDSRLTHQTRS